MSTRRSNLLLAVLSIAGTTFALLQSVVVPALPDIERSYPERVLPAAHGS